MRRLLIVDDRPKRQEIDLGTEALHELQQLPYVELCTSLKDKIGHLEYYTLIAAHRSYLIENELLTDVIKETKSKKIYLVLFSGSISQNELIEERRLNIKSTDFYNPQTLVPFLEIFGKEDSKIKLLQLAYGEELYEMPLLLDIRNIFWLNSFEEIQKNEDLYFEIKEKANSLGFKSNNLEEILSFVTKRIRKILNCQ